MGTSFPLQVRSWIWSQEHCCQKVPWSSPPRFLDQNTEAAGLHRPSPDVVSESSTALGQQRPWDRSWGVSPAPEGASLQEEPRACQGARTARSACRGEWRADFGRTSTQRCKSLRVALCSESASCGSLGASVLGEGLPRLPSWAQGHQGTEFVPNLE